MLMRYLFLLFIIFFSNASAQIINAQHCGYDFTSYFVVNVHENGKLENIKSLKISVVDTFGQDVINKNNSYSWIDKNKPLIFTPNFKIDKNGNKAEQNLDEYKWFFPFAKDYYLLSIVNTFSTDGFYVKIQDVDGIENGGDFETQILPLYPFNMYVLCSSENERQAQQFGSRTNKPIEIILEKRN